MIVYLFMLIIEIISFCYIFLKLKIEFTNYRLISLISLINYFIFGITVSIYITLLNILVMYYAYIPCITIFIYSKIKDNTCISIIRKYYTIYNFDNICKWIIIIGDLCINIFQTIIISILTKVQTTPSDNIGKTPVERNNNLDDFLLDNDEQIQELNKELDNLLSLGSSIITQTMAGQKEEQRAKVGTFVTGINTLFNTKKTI